MQGNIEESILQRISIKYAQKDAPRFINQIRIIHYAYCIIFAYIPKVNSVNISFNISSSNIIKTNSLLH